MERAYYQCGWCHQTAVPFDEQLGLGRSQLSWGLQQALGQLSAALSFAAAVELLDDLTGVRTCAKPAQVVAEGLGEQVYLEAARRGVEQAQEVVVVGDGAAWIWNLAQTHFPGAVQILDWYHGDRRIWQVGQGLYGEGSPKTAQWVRAKLEKLWAGRVEAVVADLGRRRPKGRQAQELVRQARVYLANNQPRVRYPQFRAPGYHLGRVVVESACKHLIA